MVENVDLGRRMAAAKKDPKLFIWLGGHNVLVGIFDMHGYSDYKQWTKAKTLFEKDEEGEDEV